MGMAGLKSGRRPSGGKLDGFPRAQTVSSRCAGAVFAPRFPTPPGDSRTGCAAATSATQEFLGRLHLDSSRTCEARAVHSPGASGTIECLLELQ